MKRGKAFVLLLFVLAALTAACGCNAVTGAAVYESPEAATSIPESSTPAPENQEEDPVINYPPTAPMGPIDLIFTFSKLPRPGETIELTFKTTINYLPDQLFNYDEMDTARARTWVRFEYASTVGSYSEARYGVVVPVEDVIVGGNLNWEGNPFEIKKTLAVSANVCFPKEGIWEITGYFQGDKWEKSLSEKRWIAVTKDGGADRGYSYTPEFKSGPFAYLGYFNYNANSMKQVPSEKDPLVLELDISKAPRDGEEAILTCRISSFSDIDNYSAEFKLRRRIGEQNATTELPINTLQPTGAVKWEGNLKTNTPVEFSTPVTFPETGDWEILVYAPHVKYPGNWLTASIKITVGNTRSYFGWKEYPIDRSNLPGIEIKGINPYTGDIYDPSELDDSGGIPVHIPDKALEALLRKQCRISEGDILDTQLARINILEINNKDISNLSGIEHCKNLVNFYIRANQISDLSPIASLKRLKKLIITSENMLEDISPLSSITSLEELYLKCENIEDISALSSLTNLRRLEISNSRVSDISALAFLQDLSVLYLASNGQIQDFSPLASLTHLEKLFLQHENIRDISAFSSLTSLRELTIQYSEISDISALADLQELQALHVDISHVTDILPLVENEGLGKGDKVSLSGNPLSTKSLNEYIPQLRERGVIVYGVD